MRSHLIIPDLQVKPGVPLDHLTWIGKYIAKHKPDVIIQIGDFADMESLSSYDKGKRQAENKRVRLDLDCAYEAARKLIKPFINKKDYNPELHITLGNHEHRIQKAVDDNAELDGLFSVDDLRLAELGFEVHNFLDVIEIDGVAYSHYFYNPNNGRPLGGDNILNRLKVIGYSFTMGHQQGLLTGLRDLGNGKRIRGLVAGSCYLHKEKYLGPQADGHWNGIIHKTNVSNGDYDMKEISLSSLCLEYEGLSLDDYVNLKYTNQSKPKPKRRKKR